MGEGNGVLVYGREAQSLLKIERQESPEGLVSWGDEQAYSFIRPINICSERSATRQALRMQKSGCRCTSGGRVPALCA